MEEEKQVRIVATKTFLCIVESNSTFRTCLNTIGDACSITLKQEQTDIDCVKNRHYFLTSQTHFAKSAHPCTTTSRMKHSNRKMRHTTDRLDI
jgi:hypothetical protein